MVYDRVKSCLSPALSRYVLSLVANHKEGWTGRQGLAEALDSYLANLPESSGRFCFIPVPQTRAGVKPGNGKIETHLEVTNPKFLRDLLIDLVVGMAVCLLTVRVRGQFLYQE